RNRLEEAVAIAKEVAESYVVGDPNAPSTTMGPLVSAAQREVVIGFLSRAQSDGARIVTGGKATQQDRGYFLTPAIVTDVSRSSEIAREEVFGPVLVVMAHDGDEDAIALANDSEYGLSAEVWSGEPGRAAHVARRIK